MPFKVLLKSASLIEASNNSDEASSESPDLSEEVAIYSNDEVESSSHQFGNLNIFSFSFSFFFCLKFEFQEICLKLIESPPTSENGRGALKRCPLQRNRRRIPWNF
jgi:hypothetical protein